MTSCTWQLALPFEAFSILFCVTSSSSLNVILYRTLYIIECFRFCYCWTMFTAVNDSSSPFMFLRLGLALHTFAVNGRKTTSGQATFVQRFDVATLLRCWLVFHLLVEFGLNKRPKHTFWEENPRLEVISSWRITFYHAFHLDPLRFSWF